MRYHELLADPRRNKAFAKWFGESVVVDKDGKPLPVFHGTYGNFKAFEPEHSQSRGGITYAIFEPNQVKSVFSTGFSGRSHDISA